MKRLVDILAVELKRWPDFLGDAVGQAGDGTLHNEMEPGDVEISRTLESYTLCKNFISDIVTRAEWQAAVDALKAAEFPQESDWPEGATHYTPPQSQNQNGVFYRVEGEKCTNGWPVVDGKARGVGSFGLGERDVSEMRWRIPGTVSRPAQKADPSAEWAEGELPPVGTVCEAYVLAGTEKQGKPMNQWLPGKFVGRALSANGGISCIVECDDGWTHVIDAFSYLRPILTPQQKAAKEREEAIKQICIDAGSPELTPGQIKVAEKLYAAGYRKISPSQEQSK